MGDLLGKVKLLFQKDKHLHNDLYKILGFFPRNIELYQIALSHSSNTYNRKDGRKFNNERLEFLGDAIFGAVVSDILYHRFENKREGFLTNTRSKIVQRNTLNELSAEMGVEKLIRSKTKKTSHNSYIAGNAFEALIGAIYLDRGYPACKAFVERQILKKFVNVDIVANTEVNFKSKLLEYCQKNRFRCEFTLKNVDNTDANTPVFRTIVQIEEVMSGEGKGFSKKESEQEASKDALTRLSRNDKLKNQIFGSKEKRTAMEAPEYAAVPKILEIENSFSKEAKEQPETQNQKAQNEKKESNDNSNSKTNQQKQIPKAPDVTVKEDTKKIEAQKEKKEQKTTEEKIVQNQQKPSKEQTARNKPETKYTEEPQEQKRTVDSEKVSVTPEQTIALSENPSLPVKSEPMVATEQSLREKKEEEPAKKSGRKTNRRSTKKETPQPEQIINTEEGTKSPEAAEEKPKEEPESVEKTAQKAQARQTAKKTATKKTATKRTTKKPAPVKNEASKGEEVADIAETTTTEISEKAAEEKAKQPARKRSTTKKTATNSKAKETAEKGEAAPAEQKEDKPAEKKTKSTRKSATVKKSAEKKTSTKKTTSTKKSIAAQSAAEPKEVK